MCRPARRRRRMSRRHAQISLALQQATTPQEKQAVLQDAYAKDPSAVKGWAQQMIGKVTGQTPQPAPSPYATPTTTSAAPGMTLDDGTSAPAGPQTTVSGPAPKTRAEAFAGHAARGQTTEQQAQASDQRRASRSSTYPSRLPGKSSVKTSTDRPIHYRSAANAKGEAGIRAQGNCHAGGKDAQGVHQP